MHYIFDFDGTLVDSEKCSILATQAAFKACQLAVPTETEIAYYMGIPIEKSFREMATVELTEQVFQTLLKTFRDFYKQFEEEALTLFPNIKDMLHVLTERGVTCFVVSSKKTAVLERNLQALEIARFFQDCIGSDQVQHYKPHPEGILVLLKRYGLQATHCIMIGDAIFDIQMGKAAGCRTCAVTWGSHTREALECEAPDVIVDDVLALTKM